MTDSGISVSVDWSALGDYLMRQAASGIVRGVIDVAIFIALGLLVSRRSPRDTVALWMDLATGGWWR